jgi:2,4-dienoyl-CoA reductase-like NADH-dependent reductase (Old Yellow Enzyme family)
MRDVGLWSDETEAAMARTLEGILRWSDMPIAIQLNHAGRKASTEVPWKGGVQFAPTIRSVGKRRRLPRYPTLTARLLRLRWIGRDFGESGTPSPHQPPARRSSGST